MRSETLNVPGGSLYYEVRGGGPVLLMIPGGPVDADAFAPLADRLADSFTVVTCDCRGNSRSRFDGPRAELTVETFGDDACRLLDAVGGEPAFVLGSSGGATYGLDLVARHPGRVRTLVAHEPPLLMLLPDREGWRAFNQRVRDAYASHGAFPALQLFGEAMGLNGGPPPEPERREEGEKPEAPAGGVPGNLDLFAGHLIPTIGAYEPDLDALKASSTRVVIGLGETSTPDQATFKASWAIAERLGSSPVPFPGGHGGFSEDVDGFADRLRQLL
ncbi:MAG TPA: alpha/beta hydrolase [Candidatus Dormibacteraeota bacterium]|jgi:pimeloyl-ACP methyl ester carboxylesterase|nr:alpha/beta hydrolase [Candidatus Dormibacteraeota bacterium]